MSRAYVLTAGSNFVPAGISYPSGWTRLLFNDEFNGSSIDTTKWTVRNSTTQSNMSSRNFARNCTVANGYLSIRSGTDNDVDPASHPWTSGYLDTIGKFSTTDARWEARMRMPWGANANGYWPAFWLRPDDGGLGELDIMEAWNAPGAMHQSVWYDYVPTFAHLEDSNQAGTYTPSGWHTYSVELERGPSSLAALKFYIDNTLVWNATSAASWISTAYNRAVNWNIRLNLQIGARNGSGGVGYGGWPDANTDLSQTFDVDWVRVFAR